MPAPEPEITFTAPAVQDEKISIKNAVRLLGTSEHLFGKIRGGGYIGDMYRSNIDPLIRKPFVTAGGKLPVIQTDVAAASDDSWRSFTGDAVWLTDADWLLAQCGDWTGVNGPAVLDAGYLLVGLGGLVTGAARVKAVARAEDPRMTRWDLELLGRLRSTVAEDKVVLEPGASGTMVTAAIGHRYVPQAGGAFTWI